VDGSYTVDEKEFSDEEAVSAAVDLASLPPTSVRFIFLNRF
jgi:hypothetical protein